MHFVIQDPDLHPEVIYARTRIYLKVCAYEHMSQSHICRLFLMCVERYVNLSQSACVLNLNLCMYEQISESHMCLQFQMCVERYVNLSQSRDLSFVTNLHTLGTEDTRGFQTCAHWHTL